MTAPAASGRAGAGRLLGLGARAALSTPGPVLGVALTVAAAGFAGSVVDLSAILSWNPDELRLVAAGGLGLLVLAALARGIALAWAVGAAAARIRDGQGRLDGGTVESTGLTGLGWAVGAAAVHWTLALTFWTGLASTAVVYVFGRTGLSLLGAVGLAGVFSVAAIAGPLLTLWLEVALARAVALRQGIALAGAEAWRTLGERPFFVVGAWLATVLPAMGFAQMVQAFLAMSPPPSWATVAAEAAGLLLLALIEALATVARLDAYAALELDRAGALPPPPAPPVVVPAVPRASLVDPSSVLQARLVPPPDPGVAG